MKVLLSPYSQKLPTNVINPKNFPYWKEVVSLVNKENKNIELIQVGVTGEPVIEGITQLKHNLTQAQLLELAKTCNAWIGVDNFFQHFCAYYKIPNGIVIFGQSDPKLFGYPHNTNLLKDKKYLRKDQFLWWWHESVKYNPDAFVSAETVVKTLLKVLKVD